MSPPLITWHGAIRFGMTFNALRAALDRPYARIDGDYEHPATLPIPNFVCARATAQMLALRTQCYLLLGEPDKALRELTLMHDMCRLLEARPTGQPMTLVAAMINVAITGLYVNTVADEAAPAGEAGMSRNLSPCSNNSPRPTCPYLCDGFEMESMSFGHLVETSSSRDIADILSGMKNPVSLYVRFAPHGWLFQNAIVSGESPSERCFETIDRIQPPGAAAAKSGRPVPWVKAGRKAALPTSCPITFWPASSFPISAAPRKQRFKNKPSSTKPKSSARWSVIVWRKDNIRKHWPRSCRNSSRKNSSGPHRRPAAEVSPHGGREIQTLLGGLEVKPTMAGLAILKPDGSTRDRERRLGMANVLALTLPGPRAVPGSQRRRMGSESAASASALRQTKRVLDCGGKRSATHLS